MAQIMEIKPPVIHSVQPRGIPSPIFKTNVPEFKIDKFAYHLRLFHSTFARSGSCWRTSIRSEFVNRELGRSVSHTEPDLSDGVVYLQIGSSFVGDLIAKDIWLTAVRRLDENPETIVAGS